VELRPGPGVGRDGTEHNRRYILEEELKAIDRRRTAGEKYRPPVTDAIPAHEARRISGLTNMQLHRGRDERYGCHRLGGRVLWAEKRLGPDADGTLRRIWHFSQKQMQEVREAGEYRDPEVPGWLSPRQVLEKYGIPWWQIYNWRRQGKLKKAHTRKVSAPAISGGVKVLTYYLAVAVERLAPTYRRREDDPTPKLTAAEAFLKEALEAGPAQVRELRKRARLQGISVGTLRLAQAKLGVQSTGRGLDSPYWWHFPEDANKVPELVVPPEKRPRREQALAFLRRALAGGDKPSRQLLKEALRRGIARQTYYRAYREMRAEQARPPASAQGEAAAKLGSILPQDRRHAGRRRNPQTQAVYAFCYEEYRLKGRKRRTVWREARLHFPKVAPKEERHVALFADRHADRNHLPRHPNPGPQNRAGGGPQNSSVAFCGLVGPQFWRTVLA
jgi:hypothetical protein